MGHQLVSPSSEYVRLDDFYSAVLGAALASVNASAATGPDDVSYSSVVDHGRQDRARLLRHSN